MEEEDETKWVRECSPSEYFYELSHKNGFFITAYGLTLNSIQPLQEYHLRRSFIHLFRKVSTLKLCIRKKDGQFWFRQMDHEKFDFKILNDSNFEEEFEALTEYHYDTFEGPLWCFRLLPCSLDELCHMPDIKEKYPIQYKLLFGIHHAITDGYSTISICNLFLEILNDVIAGRPINDHEQLGYHCTDEHTAKEIEAVAQEAMSDPEEVARIRSVNSPSVENTFLKAYPPSSFVYLKTRNVFRNISECETLEFFTRCKSEGVTVNSGITAAINVSIVEMLIQAGHIQDTYDVPVAHSLNVRRFWTDVEDPSKALGYHVGRLSLNQNCSNNIKTQFWEHARQINETFQTSLKAKRMWKEIVIIVNEAKEKKTDFLTQLMTTVPTSYYSMSNMGNLAGLIPGTGDHVQCTNVRRSTSSKGIISTHTMHTFRGRLLYSIDYNTAFMAEETANLYIEKVIENIKNSLDRN